MYAYHKKSLFNSFPHSHPGFCVSARTSYQISCSNFSDCPSSAACDLDSSKCMNPWDPSITCPDEPCGKLSYCDNRICKRYYNLNYTCASEDDCSKFLCSDITLIIWLCAISHMMCIWTPQPMASSKCVLLTMYTCNGKNNSKTMLYGTSRAYFSFPRMEWYVSSHNETILSRWYYNIYCTYVITLIYMIVLLRFGS